MDTLEFLDNITSIYKRIFIQDFHKNLSRLNGMVTYVKTKKRFPVNKFPKTLNFPTASLNVLFT